MTSARKDGTTDRPIMLRMESGDVPWFYCRLTEGRPNEVPLHPSTKVIPAVVTDEMIERAARALWTEHLRTTTFFRAFDELRESFEAEARTVLRAALETPDV